MSVQPVQSDLSVSGDSDPSDVRVTAPGGVITALVGALLLQLTRSLPIVDVGPNSPWDSSMAVVLPTLALPAALLWWTRTPVSAQRLLPLIVGIALVPAAVLSLTPAVARSVPDVALAVVAVLSSAALWTVTGIVLICAASLASSGRVAAAGLAAAVVVLSGLFAPTVFASMRELELPSQLYPLLLLVAATALIVGGSTAARSWSDRRVVPTSTAVSTALGGLAITGSYLVTYFVLTSSSEGPRATLGWFGGLGVALAVVALAGAALLGREAVMLVLGAGLLLGCLYGLTSAVGAGLGRNWWLPLLVVLLLVGAAAVGTVRAAREVGLATIALLVLVLVATFLVVEFGHLDEGLEIGLTLVGLVSGALAGGSIVGATVPRLVRTDDLVPVLLLTVTLGTSVSRVLTWAFDATDTTRNVSLLWICGVLVLAAAAIAVWPRVRTGSPNGPTGPAAGPVGLSRTADL